jgi:F-box/leucine-rich repeat protein 2/20
MSPDDARSSSSSDVDALSLDLLAHARAAGAAGADGWRGLEMLVAACTRLEAVDLCHCVAAGDREMAALVAAVVRRSSSNITVAAR